METNTSNLTWADIDKSEVDSITIAMFSDYDHQVYTKGWVKAEMDPSHWDRILEIAETALPTTSEEAERTAHLGFSYVYEYTPTGANEPVTLEPPVHIAELQNAQTERLGYALKIKR